MSAGFVPMSRNGGRLQVGSSEWEPWQDDVDEEFQLIIAQYGRWAIRTTPAVNKRKPKRLPGEGDRRRRRKDQEN